MKKFIEYCKMLNIMKDQGTFKNWNFTLLVTLDQENAYTYF